MFLKKEDIPFVKSSKVFVSWDGGEGVKMIQGTVPLSNNVPALVFPPEVAEMHPDWYSNNNPDGVMAAYTNYVWSVYAARMPEGKIKFFLRDQTGEIQEITWLQQHHAIYSKDWEDYRFQISNLKNRISDHQHKLKKLLTRSMDFHRVGKINQETLDEVDAFIKKWTTEFSENMDINWGSRFMLISIRLEEAETEYRKLKNSLDVKVKFKWLLSEVESKLYDFKVAYLSLYSSQMISKEVHDRAAKFYTTWSNEVNSLKGRSNVTEFDQASNQLHQALKELEKEKKLLENADIPTGVHGTT